MNSFYPRWHTLAAVLIVASLVMALAVIAMVAPATSRAATLTEYCKILVDPYSQCSRRPPLDNWGFNHANYPGSGTVSVCERADTVEGAMVSRRCRNHAVGSADDLDYYAAHNFYTRLSAGNNSGSRHTINAYGNDG